MESLFEADRFADGSRAQFVSHPLFADRLPKPVFHKEHAESVEEYEPDPALRNKHILFRRKWTARSFSAATLRITADDYYHLYINGRFVAQGPAASYPWAYNYNEIDVTPYLSVGENTFAVHCYYQGAVNRTWVSGDEREMLWFSLSLDGEEVLVSDENWLCREHTGYTMFHPQGYPVVYMESYDVRSPEEGYEAPGFDDGAWEHAMVSCHADHVLVRQMTPPIGQTDLAPVSIVKTGEGIRIDFGQEAVGNLTLSAKGRPGDRVILRYAEELNEDGSLRYHLRCGPLYEEEWVLSGGNDTWKPYDYKGFRYAEILYPKTVRIDERSILMRARIMPYAEKTDLQFVSDDPTLARVLRLCADTTIYGTQENFVDCPTREKGQYLGDVSVAGRAHAVLTGDTAMMRKAILDFCATTPICSGLMAVSCSSHMQEIADYSLQFPAQIVWVFGRDHDPDFVRRTEPFATGVYRYFLKYCNADGLLERVTDKWNLVDWPENLRDGYEFPANDAAHNVLNAFWVGFLQSMDELYALLGMPPTGRTEAVKKAFMKTFYCPETGLFRDHPGTAHGAIQSNLLPLLFGIGTEDEALRRRLIGLLAKKKLTCMGVYMAYLALAALMRESRRDPSCLDLAVRLTTDPGAWPLMLAEGATTTFEAWGKEQKGNCSLCHAWATAPLIVFAKDVEPY